MVLSRIGQSFLRLVDQLAQPLLGLEALQPQFTAKSHVWSICQTLQPNACGG